MAFAINSNAQSMQSGYKGHVEAGYSVGIGKRCFQTGRKIKRTLVIETQIALISTYLKKGALTWNDLKGV